MAACCEQVNLSCLAVLGLLPTALPSNMVLLLPSPLPAKALPPSAALLLVSLLPTALLCVLLLLPVMLVTSAMTAAMRCSAHSSSSWLGQ
jgi:hypothetical protein